MQTNTQLDMNDSSSFNAVMNSEAERHGLTIRPAHVETCLNVVWNEVYDSNNVMLGCIAVKGFTVNRFVTNGFGAINAIQSARLLS